MELGTESVERAFTNAKYFRLCVRTTDDHSHASPSYPIDEMDKALVDIANFTNGGVLAMWDCYSHTQMIFGHHNVIWVRIEYSNGGQP